MEVSSHGKHERWLFRFSLAVAALALLLTFVLVVAQVYVRWKLNQDFTFLGGYELEALTISAFAFTLGLLYLHRRN